MPGGERAVNRIGPSVDHRGDPEAPAGDVCRMMAQVLMLDVDVPGSGETSGGLANELALGGRRVRQFAAVFHVPSHPFDLIERLFEDVEPTIEFLLADH